MVIGLSPLRTIRGFTQPLTLGSLEISQGVHKLIRVTIVIKKKKKEKKKKEKWLCFVDVRRPHKHVDR